MKLSIKALRKHPRNIYYSILILIPSTHYYKSSWALSTTTDSSFTDESESEDVSSPTSESTGLGASAENKLLIEKINP